MLKLQLVTLSSKILNQVPYSYGLDRAEHEFLRVGTFKPLGTVMDGNNEKTLVETPVGYKLFAAHGPLYKIVNPNNLPRIYVV